MIKAPGINIFLFLIVTSVWAQEAGANTGGQPARTETENVTAYTAEVAYIGMKLDELITRFGVPQAVYASRGQELWQDDVVFAYSHGDFYIFKDRVWQLGLRSAQGISINDSKPAVVLTLGEAATDHGDYVLLPLPPTGWPLMLRVNFNSSGRVAAIFIYRPDF